MLLIVVAVFVAIEVKDLLIGQSVEPRILGEMRAFLEGRPEIGRIYNVLTMQFGPDAMVAVKARMRPTGSEAALVESINRVESDFRTAFPQVAWLFFDTTGGPALTPQDDQQRHHTRTSSDTTGGSAATPQEDQQRHQRRTSSDTTGGPTATP